MRKILKPKDFPALLKQIPDQPELLYMEGELPPEDAIYLAVVGARKIHQLWQISLRENNRRFEQ